MVHPILQAFLPVVAENSRVLILGSMPSVASLAKHQYYAHPHNAFWQIIHDLWGVELSQDYAARVQFLLAHGLALWDVVASCRREGSADAAIRDAVVNDFATFSSNGPGSIGSVSMARQPKSCSGKRCSRNRDVRLWMRYGLGFRPVCCPRPVRPTRFPTPKSEPSGKSCDTGGKM